MDTDQQGPRHDQPEPARGVVVTTGSRIEAAVRVLLWRLPREFRKWITWDDHVVVVSEQLSLFAGRTRQQYVMIRALRAILQEQPVDLRDVRDHLDEGDRKAVAEAIAIYLLGRDRIQ